MSNTIIPVVGKKYKTRSGEIVGPMEEPSEEDWGNRVGVTFEDRGWFKDGTYSAKPHLLDIVSEFEEGPVRTVTRREVVGGVYGDVGVSVHPDGEIQIEMRMLTRDAKRVLSAAMILSQIAEALDDKETTK